MKKLYSGILFGLALAFIVPLSFAYAEEARDETDAFKREYLTVTPPTGWEIEKQSSGDAGFMTGMLDSGIAYVRTGTMSGVVICPVFNLDELSAEWKEAEPDSFRSGRCLIQGGNDMILIMAPLKKDKKGQNGAMFIIMDEEASGAEKILQNALPLLRLFTHFDLSEAILEGKV